MTSQDSHLSLSSERWRLELLLNEQATVNPQQLILSGTIPSIGLSHETDFQILQSPTTSLPHSHSFTTVLAPSEPGAQAFTSRFDVGQNGNVLSNSGWNPNDQSGGRGPNLRSSPWSKSFLACPYYIRDPIRHFGCINLKLDTYGRVKQHLKRNHLSFDANNIGGFVCESCGMVSPDESSRDIHRVSTECAQVTVANEHGLSRQAWEGLEKRLRSGSTDEEKWLNMWFVLFHQPFSASTPIKDTVMNRFFQIIRNFCQADGFGDIISLLFQEKHGVELGSEMQMYELLMKLLDFIRDSIQQLFDTQDVGASG
ncbi:HET ankyrin domain-containing protein [Fusarium circinatum]|uniref:HET ankyrin domain-containing protein n=1 Tax=Fusarium circinatum TaxID=48490 RepID=A0A8H5X724_FUSCI|nr:HET ankyrin domain-containing protein [Fusarium circinatum]